MKKNISSTLLLFLALAIAVEGLAQKTETRQVGSFTGLKASGAYLITLKKSNEEKVEVTGPESELQRLTTEVKGNELQIKTKTEGMEWNSGKSEVKITVFYRTINNISSSGSSEISASEPLEVERLDLNTSGSGEIELEINCQSVKTSVSGSAEIELKGKTNELKASVSGSGEIEAFELTANEVTAAVSGSGKIEVQAKNSLDGKVSGSGDIEYFGEPTNLDVKSSGSGKIKKVKRISKD